MPHKTFFWFFFPSGLAMILFIGLPIFSSFFQSLHIETEQILIEVETCDPFGCEMEVQVDQEATSLLREESPLGRFNGFGTFFANLIRDFIIGFVLTSCTDCLLYTSPSPRDQRGSRMPSSA